MIDSQGCVLRFSPDSCELEQEFARVDKDGDARIDFGEFAQLMYGAGARMSATDLRSNFCKMDLDHDGLIDFGEFVDWSRAD